MAALRRELGDAGAACFVQYLRAGKGDYTQERDKILENLTINDILEIRSEAQVE